MQKLKHFAVDWLEDTHGQGWGTDQSTPLPPVWPEIHSGPDLACGASLLALYSAPRGCSLGTSGFFSSQKPKNENKNKKILVVQLCSTKYIETLNIIVIRITIFLPII